MPLQDKIGHLQADTVLVREGIPFPDTIRVSTSVLEAPWCVLEAIRPAQLGRQLFALFAKHFWEESNRRTGSFSPFHLTFEPRLSATAGPVPWREPLGKS